MIDASHPRPGAQGAATVNVRTQEDWFRFLTRLVPVSDSDIRGQALKELQLLMYGPKKIGSGF